MSELKNIIVIGGSGNVGREILAALINRKDEFGTIAAVKREGVPVSDILRGLEKKGVKLIEANYKNKESLVAAFKGMNTPYSTKYQVRMPSFLLSMFLHLRTSIRLSMPLLKQSHKSLWNKILTLG